MTLREYIAQWQAACDRPKSRPSTYNAHSYIFKNHILPKLGELQLSQLDEQRIGEFMEERRRFGGHRPESPEYPGLGAESMRHIQTLLQQVLEHAVRESLLEKNPAKAFRLTTPRRVKANVLTPMEIESYLDAADQLGYLPMFTLALTAGLRQCELITLKWSDLDRKSRILTIHEGRSVVKGQLAEYDGDMRSIPLSKDVTVLLTWEHEKHPSSPFLFIHPGTRKPFSPPMVRRMHNEITQKAGLHHVRFLDLRHTYAVNALQNGIEVQELSQILGHVRASRTQQAYSSYIREETFGSTETDMEELRAAATQMDSMLGY